MTTESMSELPKLIGDLFRTVDKLDRLFPERPFTPDGHLVGSIGEVVAAYVYGLSLKKCSNPGFDALTSSPLRRVEIKLTGGRMVSISSDFGLSPDVLLVLKFDKNGFREIYNGPFPLKLCLGLKPNKRKVVQVSLSKLVNVSPKQKALPPVPGRSFENLNRLFPNVASTIVGAGIS